MTIFRKWIDVEVCVTLATLDDAMSNWMDLTAVNFVNTVTIVKINCNLGNYRVGPYLN